MSYSLMRTGVQNNSTIAEISILLTGTQIQDNLSYNMGFQKPFLFVAIQLNLTTLQRSLEAKIICFSTSFACPKAHLKT